MDLEPDFHKERALLVSRKVELQKQLTSLSLERRHNLRMASESSDDGRHWLIAKQTVDDEYESKKRVITDELHSIETQLTDVNLRRGLQKERENRQEGKVQRDLAVGKKLSSLFALCKQIKAELQEVKLELQSLKESKS